MQRSIAALFVLAWLTAMTSPAVSAAGKKAVLTLIVNTVNKGDITVTLSGADALVRRGDLDAAGLVGFDYHGASSTDLVDLKTLSPLITYAIDDRALTLSLTVGLSHLPVSTFDYHSTAALAITKPQRSAFFNYSVGFSPQYGANFSSEAGTQVGAGVLESTATLSSQRTNNTLQNRWTMDSPASDKRFVIGDTELSTGDLGGVATLFGASVERYFGLNGAASQIVLPGIRGSIDGPGNAQIYVNGVLVQQQALQPGQFAFNNLPAGGGPNNTQIVVTDAFGRQRVYTNYFYGADQLLAPGVTDFAYGVGLPRTAYGAATTGSGPTASARYELGLTPDVTAGGRLEINGALVSGGAESILRLHHGVLGAEVGASRNGSFGGTAAALSYQSTSGHLSFTASLLKESPHYATLSQSAAADRAVTNASLSVSVPIRGVNSVSLTYSALHDRDEGANKQWQLSRWIGVSPILALQVGINNTQSVSGRQFGFTTSLNLTRQNSSASISSYDGGGHRQVSATVSRSTTEETPSFGYNVGFNSADGSATTGYGTAQYRSQYGNLAASVNFGGNNTTGYLQFAGGIVEIGRKVFPTQPLSDSYALVDADGVPGVRVSAGGVERGRTNSLGYAIVPLGSYYANTISLTAADVPMNYAIEQNTRQIVPGYHSGQVMEFRTRRVLPVTGTLMVILKGRRTAPAFGVVSVDGQSSHATSDIGENGEFYFENLAPGEYKANIEFKDARCAFSIQVPSTKETFLKLGTLVCANGVPTQ